MTNLSAESLLALATERVPGFLSLLEGLVIRESPSGDAPRIAHIADFLKGELEQRGGTVTRLGADALGEHLLTRFGDPDGPPLLVLGHMDTVHAVGTLERYPFRIEDWMVRGPGAYDMKAGIAMALHALDVVAAAGGAPRGELQLVISCDEEIGSPSSRTLIEGLARDARAALVLEPCVPGGAMKVARKGTAWYRLTVHGHPAHAGIEPEKGASAVHELARLTMRLLELGDAKAGSTVNVGVVTGGTRGNVVAAEASATIDVRFWKIEEAERIDREVRALHPEDPRCTIELGGGIDRPPLESTPASERLAEVAQRAAQQLGMKLGRGSTGGGSDGNLTSGVGCPTLDGLGPDGGGAHTLDEHVLTADIARRIALMAMLLTEL
jgi:glutamate carboxypeptidase